jgi:hypothetical protein
MSLKTWKEEFYPIPADSSRATKTEISALRHGIRKWKGLTRENLRKHGIKSFNFYSIFGNEVFIRETGNPERLYIRANSCALCQRHDAENRVSCRECSAYRCTDPYIAFINHRNPEKMIKWLKECLERELARGKKE